LSLYVRERANLTRLRVGFVSSSRLARQLGLTDAQVRRDLSYFGQFGTSGRGYEVQRLHDRLTGILGVSGRTWHVALAGIGNLGSALLAYRGFQERGFLFRVVVDTDPQKIGRTVQGITVAPASRLVQLAREQRIHIGLIAVPVNAAQAVCDELIAGGVKAIVNFAPGRLDVPADVRLRTVDLAVELESLAFHLARINNR
jgi:redox-sensing transcriptional repressor